MKAANTRPISLTLRVVLFVALTVAVCFIFVGKLLMSSIEHHFVQQDADELRLIIHSIEKSLSDTNLDPALPDTLSHAATGHHSAYYQIHSRDEAILYRNSALDFSDVTRQAPVSNGFHINNIQDWRIGEQSFRGIVTRVVTSSGNYRIISAIDMSFHLRFLTQFQQNLWLIMMGACLLTVLAAWFAVHQGLNPLRGLSNKMHIIQTNKLDVRLDAQGVPPELVDMVQSFNHMLGRLEEGFTRLSHFSADIAHELRTPLTNIITQSQVSLSKQRSTDEYRELLFSNLEEQERLSKMISDMLWLAKSHNGLIKPQRQLLNLKVEIRALFEFFEALAEDSGIDLQLTGQSRNISGDRTLLRHALTNLLSNAIRHTENGKFVRVALSDISQNTVCISVENPGEPIPAEHLPQLFDRFYRADPSRQRHSEGAGLGLAISKAIIVAHGGSIDVTSDAQLTKFCIQLHRVI